MTDSNRVEADKAKTEAQQKKQIIRRIRGLTSRKATVIARRLVDSKRFLVSTIKRAVKPKHTSER